MSVAGEKLSLDELLPKLTRLANNSARQNFLARHRDRGPCRDGYESRHRCAPSDDDWKSYCYRARPEMQFA